MPMIRRMPAIAIDIAFHCCRHFIDTPLSLAIIYIVTD
jgi:hypothetical protein